MTATAASGASACVGLRGAPASGAVGQPGGSAGRWPALRRAALTGRRGPASCCSRSCSRSSRRRLLRGRAPGAASAAGRCSRWPRSPAPALPLPRHPAARVALLAARWARRVDARSATWAPSPRPRRRRAELALLYLPATAAGAVAWRDRRAARWSSPALAAGTLVVIGYGLAGGCCPASSPAPAASGGRAPGAAADLLERDRRAGGDRARALRPPHRRRHAARARCASPPRPPPPRWAWAPT